MPLDLLDDVLLENLALESPKGALQRLAFVEVIVGSAPHSRRTTQAGDRRGSIDCRQISVPDPSAAIAELATILDESHKADGVDGLLYRADCLFRVLFLFVVLSHDRRRVVHFNVTEHPTEAWTAQQIREAFPWDEAPRYLIRDRDAIFGKEVIAVVKVMGIEEVVTAAQSPWQNPYVERLIGSIRRECLNHVIVWNERSLRRILRSYFHYYGRSRTHVALSKDAPEPRAVHQPENGCIVEIPEVGGLHHRYERRAA